jgi:hypothetical protein
VQLGAFRRAQANRSKDGSLPAGKDIARQYSRDELPDDWALGLGSRDKVRSLLAILG